jgi:hypothetical protein
MRKHGIERFYLRKLGDSSAKNPVSASRMRFVRKGLDAPRHRLGSPKANIGSLRASFLSQKAAADSPRAAFRFRGANIGSQSPDVLSPRIKIGSLRV